MPGPAPCRGWPASGPGRLRPGPWFLTGVPAEAPGSSMTSRVRSPASFPCARCPAVTVTLEAGGADTYTQRAIPGSEPCPDPACDTLAAAVSARTWPRRRRQSQGARIRAAHVEPERRVLVGHQPGVAGHPQHPPVQAEHEVEDLLRVPAGDEQDHRGDHGHDADQPDAAPPLVVIAGIGHAASIVEIPPHHTMPPVNTPAMMYCGMASSHHFTSASPRDSRCGYSTSR